MGPRTQFLSSRSHVMRHPMISLKSPSFLPIYFCNQGTIILECWKWRRRAGTFPLYMCYPSCDLISLFFRRFQPSVSRICPMVSSDRPWYVVPTCFFNFVHLCGPSPVYEHPQTHLIDSYKRGRWHYILSLQRRTSARWNCHISIPKLCSFRCPPNYVCRECCH